MNKVCAIEEDIFGNPSDKLLFRARNLIAKNRGDDEKILGIVVNCDKNVMNMCIDDAPMACYLRWLLLLV